jgi:hypothetical protein
MDLLQLAATVTVGSIFLFPAVAVLLRRRATMLWVTTGIGFCLILMFAAYAASVPEDVIPAEYGYSLPLPRSLLTYGLRLGLPQIAATFAVQALDGPLGSSRFWLYVSSLLAAMTASILGGRVETLAFS